jgi:hypothetical protein
MNSGVDFDDINTTCVKVGLPKIDSSSFRT